jgi:hypothetical protein
MGPAFHRCFNSLCVFVVGLSVMNDKSEDTIMDMRRTELSLNVADDVIK